MKIQNLPIIDISDCLNITDIIKKLNLPENGKSTKLVKDYILLHNISTDHFDMQYKNRKYVTITKSCPVCNKLFNTLKDNPREKYTCSHSCSNTYFRSGKDNPNYKDGAGNGYRHLVAIVSCAQCGFDKYPEILQVHHKDRNRSNNNIENLEVLCPNCHTLEHYQNKDGIFTQKFKND